MVIGLVSSLNVDNDIEYNLKQIRNYAEQAKESSIDLICFGESFLQGFECLSWKYEVDCKIAKQIDCEIIREIKEIAIKNKVAISFGMIEKYREVLYSSNVVIGEDGNIVDVFRRVSTGWKEPMASNKYCEGSGFHTFTYKDKIFTTAICGDLWYDSNLLEIQNKKSDIVLWPLYVDYSIKKWEDGTLDEYANRVKDIKVPVCFINSYVKGQNRANGGCYVFFHGKVVQALPMGKTGILSFAI